MIEVGQDVPGSAFERSSQCDDLCEGARHTRVAETVYFGLHQGLTADFIGIAVGVDNTLVDAPRDLKGDVLVAGKQVEDLVCKYPAGLVQGIRGPPAPVVKFLLDAPATLIESVTGQVYDVERGP